MMIAIPNIWSEAKRQHLKHVRSVISEALSWKGKKRLKSTFLRGLLGSSRDDLAVGTPGKLRYLIDVVNKQYIGKKTKAEYFTFKKESARVFDYGKFTQKNHGDWNAYKLCGSSTATLCPYCQQAFAFTLQRAVGSVGFRPTLDHFYSQSTYPFLGLSLFNLVPSCSTCNSSLKRNANFYETPHLHPFEDEETIGFDFDLENYLLVRKTPTAEFRIKTITRGADAQKNEAAERSVRTFLLDERFDFHLSDLRRFADLVHSTKSGEMKVPSGGAG
jgi:hypothetical protein